MLKYFNNCQTLQQAKELYRTLAIKNHPDKGGDNAVMQEINAEFAFCCKNELFGEKNNLNSYNNVEEFQDVINKIAHLDNIIIEVCGLWLWVSGDTRKHKETLKAAGCRWASKKMLWYWRPEQQNFKRTKSLEMFQIRSKYGSTIVEPQPLKVLN